MSKNQKDKITRALAGFFLVALIVIQMVFSLDLSILILLIGVNLLQFGFTGWCPIQNYFIKIGWHQNRDKESL